MKKFLLFILVISFIFPFHVKAETVPLFTLEDETVDFSPHGYMPAAESEVEDILPLISYFAIDTETSAPVSLPIKDPGTYQIFATFDGNSDYEKAEVSSLVTIVPVTAKIITPYDTAAYSKLENPVQYTIEPSWASDFLDITVDYFPIESADSFPAEKLKAPTALGSYYTVFNVSSHTQGVKCENKYMIYKIAPYRGKKLSEAESALSVPKDFKCIFQNLDVVYQKGIPAVAVYTLSHAAISGKVLYRKSFPNGTFSEYSEEPPVEPGEYVCEYFLGNVCIGKGTIFIDKREAAIIIETETKEYSSGGITPTARCENEDVEIGFTAFAIDENGTVSMEETPIPIKKCGKYSIIAYPKDTEHYKRTYAYGFVEIVPTTPQIVIGETSFTYDGTEKHVGVEILPAEVKYSVDYYEWEDRESSIPLGSAPTRAGKYMAVITTYDEAGNYLSATKTAIMFIDEAAAPPVNEGASPLEKVLLCALGAVIAVLTVGVILKAKKGYKKSS